MRAQTVSAAASSTCWRPGPSATGGLRITLRHILPNVFRRADLLDGGCDGNIILAPRSASGLGVQAPTPKGGIDIRGQAYLRTSWWLTLIPGLPSCGWGCLQLHRRRLGRPVQAGGILSPLTPSGAPLREVRDLSVAHPDGARCRAGGRRCLLLGRHGRGRRLVGDVRVGQATPAARYGVMKPPPRSPAAPSVPPPGSRERPANLVGMADGSGVGSGARSWPWCSRTR